MSELNLSQRIANKVFKNHGQYSIDADGEIYKRSQPITKSRLGRLGNIALGAANTGIGVVFAYGLSKHGENDTALLFSAWTGLSGLYTGMFAYDEIHAANLSLPDTLDPNFIDTTCQESPETSSSIAQQ